ncbi:hypothetical protein [Streptomyces benahoarensis]|uniref:phage terminase small subunit n=1 Tax=Streptomyces benahoarensis TaxID=2595054 RepID=UPI0032DF18CF
MPGPVPKRSDQRRRRNESDGPALVKAEAGKAPTVPRASGDWHPIAKRWFQALKDSGQYQFYEQSDWLSAVYVAEAMSRNLGQTKFSAQLFQSVMSAMTDLLTTEGARRRARVDRAAGAFPVPRRRLTCHACRVSLVEPCGSDHVSEAGMALRFIATDPETDGANCPTVWVDDEKQEIVVQGWKAEAETLAKCLETGPIPDSGDVVRLPPSHGGRDPGGM